ncbi:MAG: D-glycero-beta-D-manno-heptose 1,7-bisphosphate 7-phosphatase [Comamonas sp.]
MSTAPRLVIVSSDGTLNADVENGVQSPEDWQPLPGAMAAVARLNQVGWRVVVVTNQPGLGRGLFGVDTLHAIHSRMHACVGEAGGRIEAVFFCPHSPAEACGCRKPSPGLALKVAERYGLASLAGVPAVGDSLADIQAAIAAGCAPHLVLSGAAGSQIPPDGPLPAGWPAGVAVHRDLAAFAEALLARQPAAE